MFNNFAGGATVNSGTLSTTSGGTLGTGNVTVSNVVGAILTLGNNASLGDTAVLTFGPNSVINLNGNGRRAAGGTRSNSWTPAAPPAKAGTG